MNFVPSRECDSPSAPIAPHRGFSTKAREILLDRDQFDVTPKKRGSKAGSRVALNRTDSQASGCSSKSSTQSIPEPLTFDNIDDVAKRKAKLHKSLGELGKTRSVDQIRKDQLMDRRLMRTFAHDDILKMPSADSDLSDYPINAKPLPKKASKYEVTLEEDE
ncbi:hypothetical protein PRIPAC_70879 [Pristionchus pacificus]|uniref:Uncharacterized protein n=1 Tax=Pristionchus pacificus TaxID=54126 RepID=A0A454Y2G0_PRIPA|nr:hypothetical protein PRIPAC_70879 [Pristionchus pacificus]|eukprot:PDM71932.1 hypothetical protein PRIPAC_38339 [Pristionchus pacificus]